MRKISYFLIAIVMSLSLSGCSSYFYSTLGSSDPVGEKSENGDFVQENDTARISYNFWGENAPVTITVYNKLDEPLFMDWERSALIIGDVAVSYDPKVATLQGSSQNVSSSDTYRWGKRTSSSWSYSEGQFSGDIALPKGVEFIPPKTKIVRTHLQLDNFPFKGIPDEAYERRKMQFNPSMASNVRVKTFSEDDSPLRFRSYLTLYAGGQNGREVRHCSFERSFYLSQLIKTGAVAPDYLEAGQRKAGDYFYIREVQGRTAGLVIGAIAVTAAGVAIEAALGPTTY